MTVNGYEKRDAAMLVGASVFYRGIESFVRKDLAKFDSLTKK